LEGQLLSSQAAHVMVESPESGSAEAPAFSIRAARSARVEKGWLAGAARQHGSTSAPEVRVHEGPGAQQAWDAVDPEEGEQNAARAGAPASATRAAAANNVTILRSISMGNKYTGNYIPLPGLSPGRPVVHPPPTLYCLLALPETSTLTLHPSQMSGERRAASHPAVCTRTRISRTPSTVAPIPTPTSP